jgi:competence protein ComEA
LTGGKFLNRWTFAAAVLVVIIVAGGVVIGLKYRPSRPIEISLPQSTASAGEIYVGGEVNNPGIYPVNSEDTREDVIRAAGGVTDNADAAYFELIVPGRGEVAAAQKININTADTWLLAALPGIGEVRAEAIVAYRTQNGPFRDTSELLKVEGMGTVTLERIKDLITVGD